MTAAPPTSDVAQLRDRLKTRIEHMTVAQLRALADQIAPALELHGWEQEHLVDAPEGAYVIRFPEGKMKLSTDPPEMPPYGKRLTEEEWAGELEGAERDIDEGRGVNGRELLRELKELTA